jgi:hypothetical protein
MMKPKWAFLRQMSFLKINLLLYLFEMSFFPNQNTFLWQIF